MLITGVWPEFSPFISAMFPKLIGKVMDYGEADGQNFPRSRDVFSGDFYLHSQECPAKIVALWLCFWDLMSNAFLWIFCENVF